MPSETVRLLFMKNIFTIIILLLSVVTIYAQDPNILWQRTIGGSGDEELRVSISTLDGGFLIAGPSKSNISGDKSENNIGEDDYWIVKLSSTGNIEWDNTIGGNDLDRVESIIQDVDGGYVIGGWSGSNISGDKNENCRGFYDYWIVKLNSLGIIQWQKTIGGSNRDILNNIIQTNDGGYFLGGTSNSNISGEKSEDSIDFSDDYWVLKLDNSGNIEWQNTIGGNSEDMLESVLQTPDGGFLLAGHSRSGISEDKTEINQGNYDYWIVKVNHLGNIEWQNTIGGDDGDILTNVTQSYDGGYLLVGESWSTMSGDKTENNYGDSDYWIIKIDETGSIEWQNTIGGNEADGCLDTYSDFDGSYWIVGFSSSNISGDKTVPSNGSIDIWLLKLNNSGEILNQYSIGGSHSDYSGSINRTTDNKIFLGGNSRSDISGDKTENSIGENDYWVLKLDDLLGTTEHLLATGIALYPNPAKNTLQLNTQDQTIDQINIYTMTGSKVLQLEVGTVSPTIDVSSLATGVYYVQLYSGKNVALKKFVKE